MKSQERIAAARYAAAYDGLSTSTEQAEANARQLQQAAQILNGVRAQLQDPRLPAAHKN